MVQTDDPLLDGPVPPPPGARINAQDQLSAGRADAHGREPSVALTEPAPAGAFVRGRPVGCLT